MSYSITSPLFQEELYHYTTPVIVVLAKAWEDYHPDEHVLLKKILTSVKIDINAVQIISRPSLKLASLATFSPAKVLIFGCQTDEDIALYQLVPAQGFIVINADDLTQLDDAKKKNLWMALRQMYP